MYVVCILYIHVCSLARLQEIRKDLKFQELRHGNRLLFEALWKNKKELFWKALDTKVTFAVNEVKIIVLHVRAINELYRQKKGNEKWLK